MHKYTCVVNNCMLILPFKYVWLHTRIIKNCKDLLINYIYNKY